MSEATFRARLKAGKSPDDAVQPVAARPRLSDSRLAWPVAKAAGVGKLTYYARVRRGLDPEQAVVPVNRPRLSDGRLAWPVAKAAGVSCGTFHYRLKAGWSPDEAIKPVAGRAPARLCKRSAQRQ